MAATAQTQLEVDPLRVSLDPWIVVAFLWPLGRIFEVQLIGTLYLQDAISVVLLLISVLRAGSLAQLQQVRWLFFLGGLWLLSQVFTDIYRGSAFEDYSRGWAKIVLFLLTFAAMWLFLPLRRAYIVAYAAGMAVASYMTVPPPDSVFGAEGVRWRFGLGDALVIAIATVFSGVIPGTGRLVRFAPAALVVGAAVALAVDARSLFGYTLGAAGLCQAYAIFARYPRLARSLKPSTFGVVLLVGAFASQGPILIYSKLAEEGSLGAEAQAKYRMQELGGRGNVILGGRNELYVSLVAINDAFFLGHGSWARDEYYTRILRHRLIEAGVHWRSITLAKNDVIPSHSYLFGSWVDGGLMGGVFWAYIICIVFISIYNSFKIEDVTKVIFSYMICALMWNVLFSPFGSPVRFNVSFQLTIAFFMIRTAKEFRSKVKKLEDSPVFKNLNRGVR